MRRAGAPGCGIAELFAQRGEAAFRELERATLRGLIAQHAARRVRARRRHRRRSRAAPGAARRRARCHAARRAGRARAARRRWAGAAAARADRTSPQRLAALLEARADAYAEMPCGDRHGRPRRRMRSPTRCSPPRRERRDRGAARDAHLSRRDRRRRARARCRRASPRMARSPTDRARERRDRGAAAGARRSPLRCAQRGKQRHAAWCLPAGEQHKTLRSVEQIWEAALVARRGSRRRRGRRRRRRGRRPERASRRRRCCAACRSATCRRPCSRWSTARSAARPASTRAHGKNLIGAFHQPSFVLCDTEVLATLPAVERRAGLAEVVKSAWIDGEAAVAELERDRAALRAGEPAATVRAIRMAAAAQGAHRDRGRARVGRARAAQPRPHRRPRDRGGRGLRRPAPRRGGRARHGRGVPRSRRAWAGSRQRRGRAADARCSSALGLPTDVDAYLRAAGAVVHRRRQEAARRTSSPSFCRAGPGDVRLHRWRSTELERAACRSCARRAASRAKFWCWPAAR